MEEERARQEAAAKKAAEEAAKQEKGEQSTSQDVNMTDTAKAGTSESENKATDLTVIYTFCVQTVEFVDNLV